ncbi:phosphatidylethanolamine-binding protein [Trichinella nativa]|uniref:Phosphatidylethanolamine-binding protein n=1 Tax=Trichinella nativa TaxID=6335 RepID=A0A1Y3E781_9BILA|nr:phosphatidylethanolamine-binding protein [Trichinella nativa]
MDFREYEACDHIFVFPKSETVHAHPGMQPAKPWQVRHVPVITWSNMATHSYQTVLMVDVGSGRLQYLAYNYPKDTVVLKEYEVPLNSRDSPNPIALLVFEQNSGRRLTLNIDYSFDEDSLFDVQRFIIDNEFHETQILFATEMLHRTDSVRPEFLPPSLLATVDTWMTVTFHSPLIHFSVCCKEFVFDSADIKLDPLGDSEIDPVYLRQSPSISVSNYFLNTALSHLHYHSPYDYSNPDDAPLYTLLMLDVDASDKMGSASRPYVIWLVTNFAISSHLNNALTGSMETTVFSYSRPLPVGKKLHRYYFLLFQQNDGSITHIKPELYSSESCPTEYNGRCFFDVREFMAHHSLTLKGISWMRSKEVEYVKYEYLSREPHSDSICAVENMNCIPRASQYSSSSIFIISSSTSLFSFYATLPTNLWLLYWAFNRWFSKC